MHRLLAACTATLLLGIVPFSQAGNEDEWTVLFDGDSVEHWRGFKQKDFPHGGWKIQEGVLTSIPGGDRIDIITRKPYADFELELEWRVAPKGNSGILYRVSEEAAVIWHWAPEYQILDDEASNLARDHVHSTGSFYDILPPQEAKKLRPVGQFNRTRIVVRGNRVEHWLNGDRVLSFDLDSDDLKTRIANSKFSSHEQFAQVQEGHLGLQHHGDAVGFRNIRVRRLSETSAE